MAMPFADSEDREMGPDAVAEDIFAGSYCRETVTLQDSVREDVTVSGVAAVFQDMPYMKMVYIDKRATAHWSAARTKERFFSW